MRHWSQLATRNWRASPGRSASTVLAVAISVGMVVWITCCYESLERTVNEWVMNWVGRSHLSVESPWGKWGQFSDRVAEPLRADPAIESLTTRLWWNVYGHVAEGVPGAGLYRLDIHGIEPGGEYVFRDPRPNIVSGRSLEPEDRGKVVIEAAWARQENIRVGDTILLRNQPGDRIETPFEIIGLLERTRLTQYQEPNLYLHLEDVQALTGKEGLITTIDLRLKDGSVENLKASRERLFRMARKIAPDVILSSAEAKLRQLQTAQQGMRLTIAELSCIAFLTALFIIFSTLSMGMVQRMRQLGLMRCLGVTRRQMVMLVPLEVLPLAAVGVLLGIPIGFLLGWCTVLLVPEYVQHMAVSEWGLWLASIGGLATALLGAAVPMLRVLSISPLEASRPDAPRHHAWVEWVAAAAGGLLVGSEYWLTHGVSAELESYFVWVLVSEVLMFVGYALMSPLLILIVGEAGVWVVSLVVGLKWRLLRDQVSRAPWRSGAICSGLMVGLSLIVGLLVPSEGIVQGWQFPKQFPEAFIYCHQPNPVAAMRQIRRVPGVKRILAIHEFDCEVDQPKSGLLKFLRPRQRFVAADVEEFPHVVKLEYLEGDEPDALAQLRAGTGVLLTREFVQTFGKHVGDDVLVRCGDREQTFTVAGVVASPAIDIAVEFFQVGGEFQFMSVGAIIGTLSQAKQYFGREHFRLLLLDFDLPDAQTPEEGVNSAEGEVSDTFDEDIFGTALVKGEHSRRRRAEARVFREIRGHLGGGLVQHGSVSMLKGIIDGEIRRVTRILTAIPAVALIVAALGVANLMMANVNSRASQIAILRAVGTTKWQVIRLVMGEAAVLAGLGCALGLSLGFHLAAHSNFVLDRMLGFKPTWAVPWDWVSYGVILTSVMCLLAGLLPARHAARSNIVSALQTT